MCSKSQKNRYEGPLLPFPDKRSWVVQFFPYFSKTIGSPREF